MITSIRNHTENDSQSRFSEGFVLAVIALTVLLAFMYVIDRDRKEALLIAAENVCFKEEVLSLAKAGKQVSEAEFIRIASKCKSETDTHR